MSQRLKSVQLRDAVNFNGFKKTLLDKQESITYDPATGLVIATERNTLKANKTIAIPTASITFMEFFTEADELALQKAKAIQAAHDAELAASRAAKVKAQAPAPEGPPVQEREVYIRDAAGNITLAARPGDPLPTPPDEPDEFDAVANAQPGENE